jgi:hypothetical protein
VTEVTIKRPGQGGRQLVVSKELVVRLLRPGTPPVLAKRGAGLPNVKKKVIAQSQ